MPKIMVPDGRGGWTMLEVPGPGGETQMPPDVARQPEVQMPRTFVNTAPYAVPYAAGSGPPEDWRTSPTYHLTPSEMAVWRGDGDSGGLRQNYDTGRGIAAGTASLASDVASLPRRELSQAELWARRNALMNVGRGAPEKQPGSLERRDTLLAEEARRHDERLAAIARHLSGVENKSKR